MFAYALSRYEHITIFPINPSTVAKYRKAFTQSRWPSLADSQKVRKQTLLNFFNQHNSRYPAVNEKRFRDIKAVCALTNDPGVIEPNRILIEVLIAQLKLLIEVVERFDLEIKKRGWSISASCYKI